MPDQASATSVTFGGGMLCVRLSDSCEARLSLAATPWLRWLGDASPAERDHWELEPSGFAIYWPTLETASRCATCSRFSR